MRGLAPSLETPGTRHKPRIRIMGPRKCRVNLVPESLLPRPNDGKVSVAATRIDGMADHIVVHVAHSMLPFHPDSVAQVLAFLADGHFRHPV